MIQADDDYGGDDGGLTTTSVADRTGGPAGSGYLDVTQDPDTGEVNEELTGAGGGVYDEPTTNEETADDETIATTPTSDVGLVEETEMAVEEATGGTAFGDPETVDSGTRDFDVTEEGEVNLFAGTGGPEDEARQAAEEYREVAEGDRDLSDLSPEAIALGAGVLALGAYAYQSGS